GRPGCVLRSRRVRVRAWDSGAGRETLQVPAAPFERASARVVACDFPACDAARGLWTDAFVSVEPVRPARSGYPCSLVGEGPLDERANAALLRESARARARPGRGATERAARTARREPHHGARRPALDLGSVRALGRVAVAGHPAGAGYAGRFGIE